MKGHEVHDLLVKRAGLTPQLICAGRDSERFMDILGAAQSIHKGKEVLYGDYLKTHGSDPVNFALMEHYADIKRKFVRIEQFVKKRLAGEGLPLDEHLDSMMDICVYAAMGVELIIHYMEQARENSHIRPGDNRAVEAEQRPVEATRDRTVFSHDGTVLLRDTGHG